MDILVSILKWLGLDDILTTNAVIVAIAIIALLYIVVRWFSTNKKLKNIDKIVKTAPENIKEYLDGGQQELQNAISDATNNICQTISDDKVHFAEEIATIKTNVGTLVTQRSTVPVQQGQLLSEINSLYALHDRDQQIIKEQKERIDLLEEQNAALKQQNEHLQQELDELRPEPVQTLNL